MGMVSLTRLVDDDDDVDNGDAKPLETNVGEEDAVGVTPRSHAPPTHGLCPKATLGWFPVEETVRLLKLLELVLVLERRRTCELAEQGRRRSFCKQSLRGSKVVYLGIVIAIVTAL